MRPKVNEKQKRKIIIGVKVDEGTRQKIDYIAKANGDTTSTYIFNLITEHIKQYTKMTKINWSEKLEERKEENQ